MSVGVILAGSEEESVGAHQVEGFRLLKPPPGRMVRPKAEARS